MAYIGRGTENISNVEVLDNLTFNGSASYTLQKSSTNFVPSSANNLLISISGVVQQGNFSVSGSTITFDTTVASSDTCDWILHYGTGLITTVADGAITEAKLGSNAVTTAKINNGAITSAKLDSGLALGKIGQVVSTSNGTEWSTTSSTYSDITGLSLSITPSETTSKVLVMMQMTNRVHNGGANTSHGVIKLLRDSTDLQEMSYFSQLSIGNGEPDSLIYSGSHIYMDTPSTTSQITFKYQGKTGAQTFRSYIKNLVLMEVLA